MSSNMVLPNLSEVGNGGLGAPPSSNREWLHYAIGILAAEQSRSADTHLFPVPLANAPGISLYLKDESTHPTGSLKHRLARSLFFYALCNGWIGPDTPVIEASSGSTAVSEAYFARLLGLPYIAVVPSATAEEKLALIEAHGGHCHKVEDPRRVYAEAERIAAERNGHYMDQFTFAERATDWRGTNSIAVSIFEQMRGEPHPVPRWIVCGAGTGGTSATLGRYIRFARHKTELCVADPAGSVFHRHFADRSVLHVEGCVSLVEGIGRPRVEPSFLPDVVDRMISVEDAASFQAAHHLSQVLGKRCGPSTGTNLQACLELVDEMVAAGEQGSIVTLLCDDGERYRSTCFNPDWLNERGLTAWPCDERFSRFLPIQA